MGLVYHPAHRRNDMEKNPEKYVNYFIILNASIKYGARITRSLVLYVCFVDRCLSFCTFSFGHCAVCSSSI
jgi:hypothetical protein